MVDTKSSRDLVITRVFDAPRELVWKAWTNTEHLKRWWGPKDYTSPACTIDLRVGGKYHFSMESADRQIYWSCGVYREIIPNERLVCTDSFADEKGNPVPASHYGFTDPFPMTTEIVITLTEQGGRTTMTLRHSGLPDGNTADMTNAGWNESFDKLAGTL